jgi:hypothetical protein
MIFMQAKVTLDDEALSILTSDFLKFSAFLNLLTDSM